MSDASIKLGQLSASLSDKACNFFMHLPAECKGTHDELKKPLMAEFDLPGLQSDSTLKLSSYRRQEHNSSTSYSSWRSVHTQTGVTNPGKAS